MKKTLIFATLLLTNQLSAGSWMDIIKKDTILDANFNKVEIIKIVEMENIYEVHLKNVSQVEIEYRGYEDKYPTKFIATLNEDGTENYSVWDWCGTNVKRFKIAPNEKFVFNVHKNDARKKISTIILVDKKRYLFWYYIPQKKS